MDGVEGREQEEFDGRGPPRPHPFPEKIRDAVERVLTKGLIEFASGAALLYKTRRYVHESFWLGTVGGFSRLQRRLQEIRA